MAIKDSAEGWVRGKPVLAIITWEDYEALTETIETLSEDDGFEQLRRSLQEMNDGKTLNWEDARASL